MTDDIAAVVARVDSHDRIENAMPNDLRVLRDFAAARLAPVHQDEVIARALGVPLDDARQAEPPADRVAELNAEIDRLDRLAGISQKAEPPADLVETVAQELRAWIQDHREYLKGCRHGAHRILTAIAGRILAPGIVAVPLADLLLVLHDRDAIDGMNAYLRLRTLAEEAGDGE